jgi:uncharacterized protein (DUF952 family)
MRSIMQANPLILHITSRDAWTRAIVRGRYETTSLSQAGFIHCSTPAQLSHVANTLFRGQKGLVLLCIDSNLVEPEIVYENREGGPLLFPHIYGPLNPTAVVCVHDFPPQPDGTFRLPEPLR